MFAEYFETPENVSLCPNLVHAGSKISVLSVFTVSYWAFNTILEIVLNDRSQWPHGLRRGSPAAPLLRLWVRTPPASWISVCCACCVLSGRGLCFGLITRPEESFRAWCVWVWSWNLDTKDTQYHLGLLHHKKSS